MNPNTNESVSATRMYAAVCNVLTRTPNVLDAVVRAGHFTGLPRPSAWGHLRIQRMSQEVRKKTKDPAWALGFVKLALSADRLYTPRTMLSFLLWRAFEAVLADEAALLTTQGDAPNEDPLNDRVRVQGDQGGGAGRQVPAPSVTSGKGGDVKPGLPGGGEVVGRGS